MACNGRPHMDSQTLTFPHTPLIECTLALLVIAHLSCRIDLVHVFMCSMIVLIVACRIDIGCMVCEEWSGAQGGAQGGVRVNDWGFEWRSNGVPVALQ